MAGQVSTAEIQETDFCNCKALYLKKKKSEEEKAIFDSLSQQPFSEQNGSLHLTYFLDFLNIQPEETFWRTQKLAYYFEIFLLALIKKIALLWSELPI